ncbi:MAG: CBS domain-containing protein [Rhodobacteraceae bacterium]|nr:MAG: CBS domain-containing protein [Paracoccaceae bacterium]
MTVTAILKQKGSEEVETIRPDAPLSHCVALLAERRIGALVVSEGDGRIAGIVSERDVVRAIARQGRAVLEEPVSTAMTREVQTCGMEDRATDLLRRMTLGRFRHLPVVEAGRLKGLISIGDVVKFRIAEIEMEKGALEDMIKGMYV